MGKIGEKLKERFGPPTFFPPTVFYRYFVELSSRCLGLFMFRWVLFFLCVGKQRPCEKPARIGWFLDTDVASIAVNMLRTSPYALFSPVGLPSGAEAYTIDVSLVPELVWAVSMIRFFLGPSCDHAGMSISLCLPRYAISCVYVVFLGCSLCWLAGVSQDGLKNGR